MSTESNFSTSKPIQEGWNCFDIAVGGISREMLVGFVKENLQHCTSLLAPEIRHAAVLSAIVMNAKEEMSGKVNAQICELFKVAEALPEDDLSRNAINSVIDKLIKGAESSMLFAHALPVEMHTEELQRIVNNYTDAHERLKPIIAQCCDLIDQEKYGDGKRMSLEQIMGFFEKGNNKFIYENAYKLFMQKKMEIYEPAKLAFDNYCNKPEIILQYTAHYYGEKNWFAFQRQFANENSTSMVDVVALMLGKKITIYQGTQEIYSTKNTADETVYVQYNGFNHFINIPAKLLPLLNRSWSEILEAPGIEATDIIELIQKDSELLKLIISENKMLYDLAKVLPDKSLDAVISKSSSLQTTLQTDRPTSFSRISSDYTFNEFPEVGFPENNIARVYNQFPRRYKGGLPEMIDDLPRIAALGFNVIWINPIQQTSEYEINKRKGSLYAMGDDQAFNDMFFPGISDPVEREKLVQAYTRVARSLGVMPVFDLVLNHVGKNTALSKKFLNMGVLGEESRWPDVLPFGYAKYHEESKSYIPNEENQSLVIQHLWEPFIKKYIGELGFVGARVDAVIMVEASLQAKVYEKLKFYTHLYNQTDPIILGEFMAKEVYKHIPTLKDKGFSHIFTPGSPYRNFSNYSQGTHYVNDNCWFIEQAERLQEIASVSGIVGNHDLGTLKAIIILTLQELEGDELHDALEKHYPTEKEVKKFDATMVTEKMKERLLRIAISCNGGYYILAGDEYGVLPCPIVFDLYQEKSPLKDKWGGENDISQFIVMTNAILARLPKAFKGDRIVQEKKNIAEGNNIHIIHRYCAATKKTFTVCSTDKPLEKEQLLEYIQGNNHNTYIISGEKLFYFDVDLKKIEEIIIHGKSKLQLLQQARAQYHLGQAKLITKQESLAIEFFVQSLELYRQAFELETDSVSRINIMQEMTLCYIYSNQHDQARILIKECYEKIQEMKDIDLILLQQLSDRLNQLGLYKEAVDCLERALKIDVDNILSHFHLGKAYLNLKDNQAASRCFIQVLKRLGDSLYKYDFKFIALLGDNLQSVGAVVEANHCYLLANKIMPGNPDILLRLANSLFMLEKYDEAENFYLQAGMMYLSSKNQQDATNCFLKLYEISIKNSKFDIKQLNQLAGCLLKVGCYQEAYNCFRLVCDKDQDNREAVYHLGVLYFATGKKELAKNMFLKCLKNIDTISNSNINDVENLLAYLTKCNLNENADDLYKQLVNFYEPFPEKKFSDYLKLGQAYLKIGNSDKASECFRILKADFVDKGLLDDAILLNEVGNGLFQTEHFTEARECYESAKKKHSTNFVYFYNSACASYNLFKSNPQLNAQDKGKAIGGFKNALSLAPDEIPSLQRAKILKSQSDIYSEVGNIEGAKAASEAGSTLSEYLTVVAFEPISLIETAPLIIKQPMLFNLGLPIQQSGTLTEFIEQKKREISDIIELLNKSSSVTAEHDYVKISFQNNEEGLRVITELKDKLSRSEIGQQNSKEVSKTIITETQSTENMLTITLSKEEFNNLLNDKLAYDKFAQQNDVKVFKYH